MTAVGDPSSEPILSVEDLSVSFLAKGVPIHAVRGISFELRRGETLAIVGESGCGKSTTGLAVMGLIDRGRGTRVSGRINLRRKDGTRCNIVDLDGRALRKVRGNDVAMIFQEPMSSLNPVYTVGAQIIEAIRRHESIDTKAARRKACDMLADLGIPQPEQYLASYPHQLSGGMRQRVMIAIALAGNPRILIADEPTTALDVTIQAQILELLQRIQQRTGMAVIFISHNLGVVAEIAKRAIVMYAGEIMESLPLTSLFDRARMPYTKALLRSVPRLGGNRRSRAKLAAIPGGAPPVDAMPSGCAFHPRCQHQVRGRCDVEHPPLEFLASDHQVRCLRWRELGAEVAE
jgi:oligopeptide/dipeptide ABC transporter ATP-binding protein